MTYLYVYVLCVHICVCIYTYLKSIKYLLRSYHSPGTMLNLRGTKVKKKWVLHSMCSKSFKAKTHGKKIRIWQLILEIHMCHGVERKLCLIFPGSQEQILLRGRFTCQAYKSLLPGAMLCLLMDIKYSWLRGEAHSNWAQPCIDVLVNLDCYNRIPQIEWPLNHSLRQVTADLASGEGLFSCS